MFSPGSFICLLNYYKVINEFLFGALRLGRDTTRMQDLLQDSVGLGLGLYADS